MQSNNENNHKFNQNVPFFLFELCPLSFRDPFQIYMYKYKYNQNSN